MNLINIFIILFMLYLVSLINLNMQRSKDCKRRIMLDDYKLKMQLEISPAEILEQLDIYITEAFNEYIVLNIEFRELEFISKEVEDEINRNVSRKVVDRLSPVFLDKFALVYNKDNFPKLLSDRVYLLTLNYTVQKNSVRDEEQPIQNKK